MRYKVWMQERNNENEKESMTTRKEVWLKEREERS